VSAPLNALIDDLAAHHIALVAHATTLPAGSREIALERIVGVLAESLGLAIVQRAADTSTARAALAKKIGETLQGASALMVAEISMSGGVTL